MKKNILTIVILSLAIINVVLSSLIIFVIVPSSTKTNNLIKQVATIIDLELENPNGEKEFKVEDIETHVIENELTINLKNEVNDSKSHFAVLKVSLAVDKNSKDYKKYVETLKSNETVITDMIDDVVSKYSISNAKQFEDKMKEEILTALKEYYNSDFIVGVNFGKSVYQ